MRWPDEASNRSSTLSRSRKQYQKIEIAPRSSADVPSHTRCEWIRFSSQWITRRYCARGRHLLVEQPLDRHAERERVEVVGEVVHPLDERDHLPVGLVLAVLLDAGVHVADVRLHVAHDLALERHQQPQHPVRGGVVRAEVDGQQLLASARRRRAGRRGLGGELDRYAGGQLPTLPSGSRSLTRTTAASRTRCA